MYQPCNNKNNDKVVYNNKYVSNDINTYLKSFSFEDMIVYPLVFNKDDLEYITTNYKNPTDLSDHEYLNILFIGSILKDYKKTDDNIDGCEFELYLNQSTINKLNGILITYEKKLGKPIGLDGIIKRLIDKEYSRNRDTHYQNYQKFKEIFGSDLQ